MDVEKVMIVSMVGVVITALMTGFVNVIKNYAISIRDRVTRKTC